MKKTILTLLITLCPILAFASDYRHFESTEVNNATDKDSEYIAPDRPRNKQNKRQKHANGNYRSMN